MGGECNIKCGIFKKGFESNDHGYKETGNRRNGYTHKTLKTTMEMLKSMLHLFDLQHTITYSYMCLDILR